MKKTMIQHLTERSFAILTDDIEITEEDVNYMIDDSIIENTFFEYEDEGTALTYGYKRAFIYKIKKQYLVYKVFCDSNKKIRSFITVDPENVETATISHSGKTYYYQIVELTQKHKNTKWYSDFMKYGEM